MVKHPLLWSVLFRQLATAQRCGLPSHEVAQILAQDPQWPRAGRAALNEAAQALQSHSLVSGAFGQLPDLLEPCTAQLLKAAEGIGLVSETLDTLADDNRHLAEGLHDLRMAMAWPLLVAAVVVAMLAVMAIFVMPAFEEAFASFNAELPLQTALVFALASGAKQTWWLWGPAALGLLIAWRLEKLPRTWTRALARLWQRVGFVRHYAHSRFVVRLLRWLHLGTRDPALRLAALTHLQATESAVACAAAAQSLGQALRSNSSLSASLASVALLPTRLSLFVQLGERTGTLPAALAQLSELALAEEEEAKRAFERGCLLLLYGVLGATVAAIVVAVYLPVFKLGVIV
jgi:type IV pilus assembly protein PilC